MSSNLDISLKYVQGSQEWLDWRKTMITASEVPAILGVSPYTTSYELWMQKKGYRVQKENSAMIFGRNNESIARDRFIELTHHRVEPGIAEHQELDWMMASLDGITFSKNIICEIKSNKKEVHDKVKEGIIPEFHWMQIQIQMECSNLDECYYVSDNAWDTIFTIIKRDKEWFKEKVGILREFYDSLAGETPPKLCDKDVAESEDLEWKKLMNKSKDLDLEIKSLTVSKENIKKKLIELSNNRSTHGDGGTVRKKNRIGSIDYKAIDALRSINLEIYRKQPTTYWAIEYDK